jgi:hypothetical protein
MELLDALVAFGIAFTAYKLYRVAKEKNLKRLSIAFGFISLSYLLWASVNMIVIDQVNAGVQTVCLSCLQNIGLMGIYGYSLFFLLGISTLAYATLSLNRPSVWYLIAGLSLTTLGASTEKFITTHISAAFILTYIIYHYMCCYTNTPYARKTLLACVLLFISNITFLFSPQGHYAYILGHFIEFGAYALFLSTLLATKKAP